MRDKLREFLQPVYIYALLGSGAAVSLICSFFFNAAVVVTWLYVAALALYACRPRSLLYRIGLRGDLPVKRLLAVLVALVTIAVCILPMGEFSIWNGEIPGHRNQYELMAEAFLDGRLDFAYGDEESLAGLENPYDPDERKEAGVYYHWDHAYYKGKYYMYFGVVPVLLVFLPYRALTGMSLTTYHGTQLFVAATVAGIFALFYLLQKLFFKKLPFGVYLTLAAAFSMMSVWYASAEPALYCTAITAALALQTWSIWFFVRAVWGDGSENKRIAFAAVGALLGALVFGCRPPIALANVLVIPMLYVFLRKNKFTWKLLFKLILAALPYAAVAAGLMLYNYARFEDPFEFGQAYQLTVADQSNYKITLDGKMLLNIFNNTAENLFGLGMISEDFPYLHHGGVYGNFPILLLTVAAFKTSVRQQLKAHRLRPLLIGLVVSMLLISAIDIMWTPFLLERYRMDIYFLAGIACFLSIGLWMQGSGKVSRGRIGMAVMLLSFMTIVSCFLFFLRTASVYYPDWVAEFGAMLT